MKKILLFTVFLVLLAGIIGVIKYRNRPIQAALAPVWVRGHEVEASTIPLEVNSIGTLTARRVEIAPEVNGQIKKIKFQDGQFVKKGETLVLLDDSIYLTKYKLAQAKLIYSEANLKRMRKLSGRGIIAKQALEQAEADYKEKKADAAENKVLSDQMKLTAPFDGKVGQRKIDQGNYVSSGFSIVSLTDTKHLHIEYHLPENYLPLLKLGQRVKITTAAYPGKTFEGALVFISPTIDVLNRSISLYANVENKESLLAPGMFVTVLQMLGSEEKVLMVPARTVVPALEGKQVYKIVEKKALAVNVLTGRRIGNEIQIVQGLSKGDIVITDGQLKIKSGTSVQLTQK